MVRWSRLTYVHFPLVQIATKFVFSFIADNNGVVKFDQFRRCVVIFANNGPIIGRLLSPGTQSGQERQVSVNGPLLGPWNRNYSKLLNSSLVSVPRRLGRPQLIFHWASAQRSTGPLSCCSHRRHLNIKRQNKIESLKMKPQTARKLSISAYCV